MIIFWLVFLGGALTTQIATWSVTRLGRAMGLVDQPGARKVHTTAVPRIGGVAIVAGTLLVCLLTMGLDNDIGLALRQVGLPIAVLMAGGVIVFLVGLWDDIHSRPAVMKLLVLLGAAGAIAFSGSRIESLSIGGAAISLGWASWPTTVLWIVGVTVAMNFIDGLDGLAAGIALVVCSMILVLAILSGQVVMVILMLAMTGSLTGFLFFNFNPAKVFMGDCGSMFLGFMIGGASVICQAKTSTLVGFALPALAMGLPLLDTLLTFVRRRVLDRRSIFAAERGHIHHRLLDKGLSHKSVVLVLYGVTLAVVGLGLLMLLLRGASQLMALAGSLLLLLMAFRLAGAGRLKETLAALHRNSHIAQETKRERHDYDDVQLQLRQARTFEDWWQVAGQLAQKMEFDRLKMAVDGGGKHLWMRDHSPSSPQGRVDVEIDIGGSNDLPHSHIDLRAHCNGSMEALGRRLSLFGRMLDESPPPTRSDLTWSADVLGEYHAEEASVEVDAEAVHSDEEIAAGVS